MTTPLTATVKTSTSAARSSVSLAPAAFFAPCSACSRLLFALAGGLVGCGEPGWLVGRGLEPGEPGVPVCVVWGVVVTAEWPGRLPGAVAPMVGSRGVTGGDNAGGVPVGVPAVALDVGAVDVPVAELLVDGGFEAVVPGADELVWDGSPGL
jgi:hypothetical protein